MKARRSLLIAALLLGGLLFRFRLGAGWTYAGADSYAYVKMAESLRVHHRLALAPPPAPVAFARPPGYATYLMLVGGSSQSTPPSEADWRRFKFGQHLADVFGMGLAVLFLATRLGGSAAGLAALAAAMFIPFNAVATSVILPDSLAASFGVIAVTVLVFSDRRALHFFAAGALIGLTQLFRVDAVTALAAVAIAAFFDTEGALRWKTGASRMAMGLLGFVLVAAPWWLRNMIQFGEPYVLGQRVNRMSHPIEHWRGFHAWMNTWSTSSKDLPLEWHFFDAGPLPIEKFPHAAFADNADRAEVSALLAQRAKEGPSRAVDDGFAQLARARNAAHPLRAGTRVLERAFHLWCNPHHDFYTNPSWLPWRELTLATMPLLSPLASLLALGSVLGSVYVFYRRRSLRRPLAILWMVITTRTGMLALVGYCEPRYVLGLIPLTIALCAVSVAVALQQLKQKPVAATQSG